MAQGSEEWDRSVSLVVHADREAKAADLRLRQAVQMARNAGHSWGAIGLALGSSEQSAHQRFGTAGREQGDDED